MAPSTNKNCECKNLLDVNLASGTVSRMDETSTFPKHLLPTGYLDIFTIAEYKFRWHEATGLDPVLHFRANHLASRLTSLRVIDGHVQSAKDKLARVTNTSIRTMDRALVQLENRGWVDVNRDEGLSIFLLIPNHGLQLLVDERQASNRQRDLRLKREYASHKTLEEIARAVGIASEEVRSSPDWKVVRAQIRSATNRMYAVEEESRKLLNFICESWPKEVRSPQALISSRIADHLRHYTHLSHRPTKSQRGRR